MGRGFAETSHLKCDRKAYAENWERIFGSKQSPISQDQDASVEAPLPDEALSTEDEIKAASVAVASLLGK